jgi:hypothetical protein
MGEYTKARREQLCHEWHPSGLYLRQETALLKRGRKTARKDGNIHAPEETRGGRREDQLYEINTGLIRNNKLLSSPTSPKPFQFQVWEK